MALVTLEDTKTFLGITGTAQDDVLNLMITQVSTLIERLTGRTFGSTVYTDEEYDGTGNRTLRLKQYPVITFTRLQKNDATDNRDDWSTISTTDYWVDLTNGLITKTSNNLDWDDNVKDGLSPEVTFDTGKNRYRATYTAGYASVPDDIQLAAMSLISQLNGRRTNMGIKSETLGDHTIQFMDVLNKDSVSMGIINLYRDITLA